MSNRGSLGFQQKKKYTCIPHAVHTHSNATLKKKQNEQSFLKSKRRCKTWRASKKPLSRPSQDGSRDPQQRGSMAEQTSKDLNVPFNDSLPRDPNNKASKDRRKQPRLTNDELEIQKEIVRFNQTTLEIPQKLQTSTRKTGPTIMSSRSKMDVISNQRLSRSNQRLSRSNTLQDLRNKSAETHHKSARDWKNIIVRSQQGSGLPTQWRRSLSA